MNSIQLLLQALLILVVSYALATNANECIATIQNGTILGATADTVNPLKRVCAYTGIPFAAPPVGPLRFKPPQPAHSFGTINATNSPNWCPQAGTPLPGITISEDCLFLNVYQPVLLDVSTANLPVMIWFHGGSFTGGNTITFYQPTRLLARGDVILVVVHYRLGMLGFLSTGDYVAPGNWGLKDASQSIRWVNENIAAFGGNPNNVIIFGESAGAGQVIYQLVSPLNKGLIHGAIAQSGTALEAFDQNPAESAKYMAERLNCPSTSSQEIVDCISQLSWEDIIKAQSESGIVGTLTPVVEPDLPGAVVTREVMEIMKNGDLDTTIPVMLGANKHEGSGILAGTWFDLWQRGLDRDPEYLRDQLIPDILKSYNIQGDSANRALASTLEMTYLDGVNRSNWEEIVPGVVDIMTVFSFKSSMLVSAELLSRRGSQVYLYSFEHHSENSVWEFFFGSLDIPVEHGIMHGDELIYLFDFPSEFSQFSPQDQQFSDMFCDMWINFAYHGNPTPAPSDRYEQWPTYDSANELYMKLNLTPTAISDYRSSWRPNGFEWN